MRETETEYSRLGVNVAGPVWVLGYPEDVKGNHSPSMYMLLIC